MADTAASADHRRRGRRATAMLAALAMVAGVLASVALPTPAGAVPAAPTNLSPAGTTVAGNPLISWDPVVDADRYKIEISSSPAFTPLLYNITTYNTSFTPFNQLPTGDIHYRVAAIEGSTTGPYSQDMFSRVLTGPTPSSPANGAVLDFPEEPPTFSWAPLGEAVSYRLEVDDDQFFTSPAVYITYSTTFTQFDPQVPGNRYYWRVRGATSKNGGGEQSQWSPTQHYDYTWTTKPNLVSPISLATVTDVELVWDPVLGADRYDLQVSKSSDFSGAFEVDTAVYGTNYSPSPTLDNGAYYWRVRPRDYDNELGTWSDTGSFIRNWTDAPSLTAPSDGAIALDPMRFSWSPVERATHYEVQVGDDPSFSPGTYASCDTLHTSIMDYGGDTTGTPGGCSIWNSANYAGVYGLTRYWRVRGIDENTNVNGLWSPIYSFTRLLDSPDTASYGPADGATVSTPTLSWDPVQNVDRYNVVIYKDGGATKIVDVDTTQTTYTPSTALDPADSPFLWYVISLESGHPAVIPSSILWSSFTLTAPATVATPTILSPAFEAAGPEMPSMSWTPVTGADRYDIYYGNAGTGIFNGTPLESSVRNSAWTEPETLPPGSYDFYVVAKDGSTELANSNIGRFEITEMPAATFTSPADCPPGAACTVLTSNPVFEWEPVPYAGAYYVYLAYDENFTNIVREYRVPTNTFITREELPDNDAGQAYYWHVRSCRWNYPSTLRECGPDPQGIFPTERAFQKRSAEVLLVSPANGETVADLTRFEWQDYQATNPSDIEAEDYRIQVATDSSFNSTVEDRIVDQPFFTPFDRTYPEGPLYWRVRAVDGSGNQLKWSDTWSVTKQSPPPVLVTPTPGEVLSGVPTLSWEAQPFAAAYVVEIAENGDLNFAGTNRFDIEFTTFNRFTSRKNFPVGTYAWRVRREDGQGKDGPWSDGRLFTITGEAPTLLGPLHQATLGGDDVVFTWSSVAKAASYRYQRSDTTSFASIKENRSTVMSQWAPYSSVPNGTWYWRVIAYDADGVELGTSSTFRFTKVSAVPGKPSPVIASSSAGRVVLSWLPPTEPGDPEFTQYNITLEPGGVTATVPRGTNSITFNGLTNGVLYTLTIAAATPSLEGPTVTRTGTPNGCGTTPFSDVDAAHAFCEEIAWLAAEGISTGSVLGDGTVLYKPGNAVTRQAMAAFLYRFAGEPAVADTGPFFADVPKTHPFYDAIEWMAQSGLSTGSPNPPGKPLYKPTDAVSRQAMAAFLHRFAGSPAPTIFVPYFSDVPSTHPFYSAIQWMGQSGLSTGSPNPPGKPLYKPTPAVSRQAMAAFLFRFDGILP